ncbi:ABC transporter ATP-binding protein [Paenibacillus sp. UNC451MF]|uniref:ABC transporter ATP-binding protein n=1 Tax=Paenibacillus sp. UNC451MF TaxID=1449063 RepID=UPI00048CE201|nr:ATP-binding cassette domain-containing protein [Paenibacillus sp. UNC451MF]
MKEFSALEINGLRKNILQQDEWKCLFSGVTARLTEPSIIALLGLSGQGKSTLLRIIGMLDAADEGTIQYEGRLASEWSPQAWRKKVCYVAQHAVMLEGSVEHNLQTVSLLHRTPFNESLAAELLRDVGLDYLDWNKKASDLSGGEKQRLALVRSLLMKPQILLLDEITASLDLQSKQSVEQLLKLWHSKEGTSMIWVTHDLEQARYTSQRIWFMANHTLLEDRSTKDFFERPDSEIGRQFLQVSKGDEGVSDE